MQNQFYFFQDITKPTARSYSVTFWANNISVCIDISIQYPWVDWYSILCS